MIDKKINDNIRAIGFLLIALLIFSLQNISVKFISGDYSILQIVTFRSMVALPATLLFYRGEGKRGLPKTKRHTLEFVRGLFLFLSYTTHFMGLASLPLADIETIRFSGPLMITILSVILLIEKVEWQRWAALVVGFIGILIVVNPGSATFNIGSIFILISVLFYALNVMLTRKLQDTESSATMAYFSSLVYLVLAIVLLPLPKLMGDVNQAHPSIAFLLRAWSMPTVVDLLVMAGLGLVWAGGMFFMAKAYSVGEASAVAPFEYASLLISTLWGLLLFAEVPTWTTILGAVITLASGLYVLLRERKKQSVPE